MRLSDCARHIKESSLGGLPQGTTIAEISNHAGLWLFGIEGWNFLERQTATLDFVADQNYAELPSNLVTVVDVQTTNSLTSGFDLTTLTRVLDLRTKDFPSPNFFYGAVSNKPNTNGVPEPILEVWPTPSSASAGALTMVYRAGWTMLTDDSDHVSIPVFMEPIYVAALRAFAKGYEEEDDGNVAARLAGLRESPLFESAKRQDRSIQGDYGQIMGGITDNLTQTWGGFWRERTFNAPS